MTSCGLTDEPSPVLKVKVNSSFQTAFSVISDETVSVAISKGLSSALLTHPEKTNLVLVGSATASSFPPSMTVWSSMSPVPSLRSNVTVNSPFQRAFSVISAEITSVSILKVEPSALLTHPEKTKPSFVGLTTASSFPPSVTVCSFMSPTPSSRSKETVNSFVQTAFSVMSEVTASSKLYGVLSSCHSLNV